jgi:hypothetical protein
MSLEQKSVVDQITVTENNIVMVRTANQILNDGQVINTTYERTSLVPGQDLTGQDQKVVAICNSVWTQSVIANYQAQKTVQTPTLAV